MPSNHAPVWFITGCSTGLGRALATAVLEQGRRAVVTARDPLAVADIVAGHEDRAVALALDVTDPTQIEAAIEAAHAAFGRIDVLVNNAGYGHLAAVEEGEDHEIRALFDANVFGLVDVTRGVLPGMRARRSGHIVNISSLGGLAAFGATGYYHATKFAVEGLSESLAAEVAPLGVTSDQVQASLELSVLGAVDVVQAVLPQMRRRGRGTLLFTTGGAAVAPSAEASRPCAADKRPSAVNRAPILAP
jgi:NADP-dependent 3-hydroxy acid dehydrogenase YdfG